MWSLAVEEQFYLAWPAIVLLLNSRRLLWACATAVVAACGLRVVGTLLLHQTYFAYTFTLCRVDGLAIGSALAVLGQTERGRKAAVRVAGHSAHSHRDRAVLCLFSRNGAS